MRRACVIAVLGLSVGCVGLVDDWPGDDDPGGSDLDDPGGGADGDSDGGAGATVTYRAEVAPVLARRCVGCHVTGGVAPFPLDSYAAAFPWRAVIADVTARRQMPPWGPVDDGSCRSWEHSRYLSAAEIEVFSRWDEQGGAEGDTAIPIPGGPPLPTLAGANVRGDMSSAYAIQAGASDEYRCFSLSVAATGALPAPDASGRVLVGGFDVAPGNRELVHHAIVWATTEPAATADPIIAAKQAEDAAPGWRCGGDSGLATPHEVIAVWAPGTGATHYPAPTGIAVRTDARLIMQVHYSLHSGAPAIDPGTSIALAVAPITAATRRASWFSVSNTSLAIPPQQASYPIAVEAPLHQFIGVPAGISGTLYGVYPHMHTAGTHIQLLRPSAGDCVVDVPRWDFHWQAAYFLAQPAPISTSDTLRLTCDYNTTNRTATTVYGPNTSDEMCMVLLYAAP